MDPIVGRLRGKARDTRGQKAPHLFSVAAPVLGRENTIGSCVLGKPLHEGLGKLLGMPTVLPLNRLRCMLRWPADLDAGVVVPPNAIAQLA